MGLVVDHTIEAKFKKDMCIIKGMKVTDHWQERREKMLKAG